MKPFPWNYSWCMILMLCTNLINAQAFELDDSFSTNGHLETEYEEGYSCQANDVVVFPDGKILVAGSTKLSDMSSAGCLWKLLPDSRNDQDFNHGSPLLLPIPDMITYADEAIRLPNNNILVLTGQNANLEDRMALQIIHPDGTREPTFGTNGIAKPDLSLVYLAVRSMALLPEGGIMVSGYGEAAAGEPHQFMLIKFTSDGAIDEDFGTHGYMLQTVGEADARSEHMAIQSDGKIVLTGHGVFNGEEKLVVARFLPNGIPDPEFADHGLFVLNETTSESRGYRVSLQPDGKIVAAGYIRIGMDDLDWLAIRLLQNGTLDPDFGNEGLSRIIPSPYSDQARAMVLQPDGKILLGGYAHSNGPNGIASTLVRLTAGGHPDPDFGINGILELQFNFIGNLINSLTLQPDGKIVASGIAIIGSFTKALILRFNTDMVLSAATTPAFLATSRMYPNPAVDHITVELKSPESTNLSIDVMDNLGRSVQTLECQAPLNTDFYSESFQLSGNLSTGRYYVRLASENKAVLLPLEIIQGY